MPHVKNDTLDSNEARVEVGPLTIRASIGTIDAEARTVELVFSTGAAVLRYDWMTGERYTETLSLDPKHVRLGRLNSGAPFCDTHNTYSLAAVLGVVVEGSAKVANGEGRATVRFSKRADVEPIWQDVRDGIIKNVSVGYRVHKYEQSNGTDGKLPTRRAVDWEPYEISAVPIGADAAAQIRAEGAKVQTNPCVIVTRVEDTMKDPNAPAATATAAAPEVPAPTVIVDAAAERAAGAVAERARAEGIEQVVRAVKLEPDFAAALIKKGVTVDAARAEVLDELVKREEKKPEIDGRVRIGEDAGDKWYRGAAAWMFQKAAVASVVERAMKVAPDKFQGVSLDPGEFRGLTMLDLARESLQRAGVNTRGMDKMTLVGKAFTHLRSSVDGAQSTSDFAVLLENVMYKTLLASYATTPDTWSRFCVVGSVGDFRAHNRYRMGTFGRLDRLNQVGEFKNKSIPDGEKQSITADTRGNIIALTRQAIINDDMDAFSRLATMLGRAAKLSIEVDVFDMLKENGGLGPTLSDGKTLFHADHNNIGAAAELGAAGLDADRVKMASQVDVSGNEILDLRPAVLVVAIGLGGTARTVNEAQFDPGVEGEQNRFMVPNMVRGLFRDIVDSPRLTGTRRYMLADPSVAAVFEVAFLDGEQSPFLETQNGWRIDGVEQKVRLDYGVAGIDFRGAVTNAG